MLWFSSTIAWLSAVLNQLFQGFTSPTSMISGIASAVGGLVHPDSNSEWVCGFSVFVLQATIQTSALILFTIALNLQLVVVHQVNTLKWERYYVIGSILISLAMTIPAYATGQYGPDPLTHDCWYAIDSKAHRIAWQISAQIVWTAVIVFAELITTAAVLLFILRHHLHTKRILADARLSMQNTELMGSPVKANRVKVNRWKSHWILKPRGSVAHAHRYNKIILRVAIYPTLSCFINLMSAATTLHATINHGVHNQKEYNLLLLGDLLYGGRPILYAILAATDPSLINGAKALLAEHGLHFFWGNRPLVKLDPKTSSGSNQKLTGMDETKPTSFSHSVSGPSALLSPFDGHNVCISEEGQGRQWHAEVINISRQEIVPVSPVAPSVADSRRPSVWDDDFMMQI
jgi:hypothetical protein